MGDTIIIETPVATVLEVSGKQGPQGVPGATGSVGPKGDKGDPGTGIETLTTKGDLLSRNDSGAIRVGIGSTGQVLKVSAQGLPTWANESGAVTSVNGQTGAVTVAAATHASEHEPGEGDTIQATAALVTTNVAALNGIYFSDDTSTNGKLNFFRTGTRKNTKLQYNSNTVRWELIRNTVVEAEGDEDNNATPWGQNWQDPRTPSQVTSITVARVALETMVQKLAETGGAATATTSEDGLMSSADKTKLNGIAANAEVNVNADWNASSGDAQILNKPTLGTAATADLNAIPDADFRLVGSTDATKKVAIEVDTNVPSGQTVTLTAPSSSGTLALAGAAPASHAASHAAAGSDPLFDQDLNSDSVVAFGQLTVTGNVNFDGAALNDFAFATSLAIKETANELTGTFRAQGDSLTANRTYDLPDASGTLALTSDIPTGVTSVSGTAPIVSSGGTTPAISITDATTSASGAMSASDKVKLDGIASGATANSSDATLLARANHTGTQAASTITGLAAIATSGSASDLTTGTVGTARLGTGTADNTTFLRGDGTWSAAGVSDGDKGDITVSNGGATWTIDANAVTNADLAQVATATIKGRATAGTGNVEDLTASQARGVLALATTDNVTFASLSTSPAANTSALTSTGYSLTGSNAQSLVDLAGTWNTTGTPSAIKLNVTDTASNASSLLMQLQTGGTNRLTVTKAGAITSASTVTGTEIFCGAGGSISGKNGFPTAYASGVEIFSFLNNNGIMMNSSLYVGWSSGTPTGGPDYDVRMFRDAAAVLALRNGTNAQESRIYGTFTSSTNYQRMTIKSVKQTLSALSGASATTTGTFIPDGAVVVGVTTRVATALTGAAGYTIGDGTDADRWGDITGTAIGTTSDNRDWTAGTIECFTAGGEITLTAKTSNFTAGAIEICVFYLAGEAD